MWLEAGCGTFWPVAMKRDSFTYSRCKSTLFVFFSLGIAHKTRHFNQEVVLVPLPKIMAHPLVVGGMGVDPPMDMVRHLEGHTLRHLHRHHIPVAPRHILEVPHREVLATLPPWEAHIQPHPPLDPLACPLEWTLIFTHGFRYSASLSSCRKSFLQAPYCLSFPINYFEIKIRIFIAWKTMANVFITYLQIAPGLNVSSEALYSHMEHWYVE